MILQEVSWRKEEIKMVCMLTYREHKISQIKFHKKNLHTHKYKQKHWQIDSFREFNTYRHHLFLYTKGDIWTPI